MFKIAYYVGGLNTLCERFAKPDVFTFETPEEAIRFLEVLREFGR